MHSNEFERDEFASPLFRKTTRSNGSNCEPTVYAQNFRAIVQEGKETEKDQDPSQQIKVKQLEEDEEEAGDLVGTYHDQLINERLYD